MNDKVCSICKKKIKGFGNNPWPYEGDYYCDECNMSVVIPRRIAMAKNYKDD